MRFMVIPGASDDRRSGIDLLLYNHSRPTAAAIMVPWHEISSVFLDMDGTLLDLHFDNHFWREHVPLRYAERHNLDVETAKSALFPKFRDKEGTMDWYCVEYWSRELELDITALKHEINHLIAVHDHVDDFSAAYPGQRQAGCPDHQCPLQKPGPEDGGYRPGPCLRCIDLRT